MLHGVDAFDLVPFGCVSTMLCAIAARACWIPARRPVDPMVALREE